LPKRRWNTATGQGQRFGLRTIYILPSYHGVLYLLLLLVMLLCAINYNNSMIYALCFLLGGVFAVCLLHTYRNLHGLELTALETTPVFVGERAVFPMRVGNPTQLQRHALSFTEYTRRAARRGRRRQPAQPLLNGLEVGADAEVIGSLTLPAQRRGWRELDTVCVSTTYPLGLFRAWTLWYTGRRCLLYPRAAGDHAPPPTVQFTEDSERPQPGVEDFYGLRPYQDGDPMRSIAWRAQRNEELWVTQFVGGGISGNLFTWEAVAHLGDDEAKLSQLCQWVLQADRQCVQYGLSLPGVHISPQRGEHHRHRCLRELALYGRPR